MVYYFVIFIDFVYINILTLVYTLVYCRQILSLQNMIIKSEQVNVKVDVNEKAILEKSAKRREMTVSQYIRALVLIDAISEVDRFTFIGMMHNAIILLTKKRK